MYRDDNMKGKFFQYNEQILLAFSYQRLVWQTAWWQGWLKCHFLMAFSSKLAQFTLGCCCTMTSIVDMAMRKTERSSRPIKNCANWWDDSFLDLLLNPQVHQWDRFWQKKKKRLLKPWGKSSLSMSARPVSRWAMPAGSCIVWSMVFNRMARCQLKILICLRNLMILTAHSSQKLTRESMCHVLSLLIWSLQLLVRFIDM